MIRPIIDWDLCQSCNPCTARPVCRTRAIIQIDSDEPPYIEYGRCNNCALCVAACTYAAISMRNIAANIDSVFDFRA